MYAKITNERTGELLAEGQFVYVEGNVKKEKGSFHIQLENSQEGDTQLFFYANKNELLELIEDLRAVVNEEE